MSCESCRFGMRRGCANDWTVKGIRSRSIPGSIRLWRQALPASPVSKSVSNFSGIVAQRSRIELWPRRSQSRTITANPAYRFPSIGKGPERFYATIALIRRPTENDTVKSRSPVPNCPRMYFGPRSRDFSISVPRKWKRGLNGFTLKTPSSIRTLCACQLIRVIRQALTTARRGFAGSSSTPR